MRVSLQWYTPGAENQIAYIARGSNPPSQDNPEFKKLFRYCLKNSHWSPFQMAYLCLEFETSLAIAAQVKRHWSIAISEPADIQETSMRYMDPFEHGFGFQGIDLRKQAASNRQSSSESFGETETFEMLQEINLLLDHTESVYKYLKNKGVANEVLRMVYPMATTTRFFICGSCRSWIHYFQQRLDEHAQKEHRELAQAAWQEFELVFPTIAKICLEEGIISL